MKKGDRVQLHIVPAPPDANGKPAEFKGVLTAILPGHHGVVKFTSISEGVNIAVKDDGNHVLLGAKEKLPSGATLLKVGDESTFALAELRVCDESNPHRKITYEQAAQRLGKYSACLDSRIEAGETVAVNGMFDPHEIESIKTICGNVEREQFRFGDEAQEFGKLAGKYMNKVFPNSVR